MLKYLVFLLWSLFLLNVLVQPAFARMQLTGRQTFAAAAFSSDTVSSEQETAKTELDSLKALSDSLASAVDSLASLVDSLAAGPELEEKVKKENPWSGNFALGLTLNRGNSDQRSLVVSLRMNRKGAKSRFSSSSTITNSRGDEGEATNKGSFKSKYEIDQSKRFFYFANLDLNYHRQAGLNLRVAPGVGVGLAIIATDKARLNLNLGANPITEYWRDEPRRTKGHYLGSQDFGIDLNSRSRLEQSLTYKPRFNQVNDYIFEFSIALTNQLTSAFDLKLTLESIYNSRPPIHDPPYKRQDWMVYTAVGYNLW